jgi:S-adenosylmethionine:tRNA ribosyltransferase-isomerase
MRVEDFDYYLPDDRIARYPLAQRSASRLLCVARPSGQIRHATFAAVAELLQPCDLLVFNNTRVIPARLFGAKATGGQVEILLERVLSAQTCIAQLRASKALTAGGLIYLDGKAELQVTGRDGQFFCLQTVANTTLDTLLQRHGHMPLPPYIDRADEATDRERYQTVYSSVPGAVAAPTAGLHFDAPLLQTLRDKGVNFGYVTLHVGAGTYQPVRVERIEDHVMHAEWLCVDTELCRQVAEAKAAGRRVIAVGTTAVRALESAATLDGLEPFAGDTRIFIYPGYQFRIVDGLITNFHLPKSTLLMLVSALAGWEVVRDAYAQAIAENYRFFSYGDAMFIGPEDAAG